MKNVALILFLFCSNCLGQLSPEMFLMSRPSAPAGSSTDFITSFSGGTSQNAFSGTVGGEFRASNNVTVTAIGCWVKGGSSQTHRVGLWTAAGSTLAIVSISFSGLSEGWHFVNTNVSLTAGQNYKIGAEMFSGGDTFWNGDTTLTTTPVASFVTRNYLLGSFGSPSTAFGGGNVCYVPCNFKYTNP